MGQIIIKNFAKIFWLACLLLLSVLVFWQVTLAGDQSKTSEFFVGSYPGSLSSTTDFPFNFLFGDDLTGVSNPVKSAFFIVSGVYTGGGSLELMLDSDPASARTFNLPSVSKPTDFSLSYRDLSGKLEHTSAGVYNHTLNINLSGVTTSGLSAKLETTHQFAPKACVDGPSTNQKVKTSEFFVAGQTASFDSSVSLPVSIYIGDDLSDINDPVKSFHLAISGVYTGGGNFSALLSNDGLGTSTDFYLPNVSTPTNFSFVYRDKEEIVSPVSAGTYNYLFDIALSGPTISNLAVKAVMTHRYKPVSCGAGYPPYGDLISAVFDLTSQTDGPAYNSVMWKGKLGGASFDQGHVKFQFAASDNSTGPWNYVGGTTCSISDWYEVEAGVPIEIACYDDLNNKRYFRYKVRLCSDDCIMGGTETPQVDEVVLSWSP